MKRFVHLPGKFVKNIFRAEPVILLAAILAAWGMWGFIELADEVMEEETRTFDEAVLLFFRNPADLSDPVGPVWFEEAVRDITALGGTAVMGTLVTAVLGFVWMTRKHRMALDIILSVGGGMILSSLLKEIFERPRPDLVPHYYNVLHHSFPSGHSMMSAVVYLTLGALLASLQSRWSLKIYIMGTAMALTFLVGISRIYLGVHWPTDVLAGWAAGAVWALFCWSVTRWLQQKGQVEREE